MPLVAAKDFESLPSDPMARWLQLRDLMEKRLDSFDDMNEGGNDTVNLLEYVHVLTAAADELGVGALETISPANVREEFDVFRASVAGLATRLSLRSNEDGSLYSVSLGRPTRKKILIEIETLRALIKASELSESQKSRALGQVDQLQVLIIAPKTDIARVGVLLAGIGAFAVGTTAFLADAPKALGTISALVGAEKIEEETEQALIEGFKNRLQIEDLREPRVDQANDEIPF
ncbi:MAG: hypothetical protein JJU40_01700 [Rhodobacteraceae bacterium]|nr:hypothetical protein [Paracoccaceae bacterium]